MRMVTCGTPAGGDRFDSGVLDQRSYQLGMVYAFAEMVGSGVKRLALSPALTEDQFEDIVEDVRLIAEEYGLVLHVDRDFLETKLFSPEYTRGKIVIHLAAERATIDEYEALKERKRGNLVAGTLTEEADLEIARGLGRLLSYSEESVQSLLEKPRF
jgi:hypothetical protein